jgi:uncharacterized membrane protein
MIPGRLIDTWLRIQASYWFIPGLMATAAVIAAIVMVQIDAAFGDRLLANLEWLRVNQAQGARALLSTVAGSMITVAGVVFSVTLIAVSHATSQIGPHLLAAFKRDRANQITLGTFIATFLYCLTLLRSVHASSDSAGPGMNPDFVPHLAINGALIMAMLSVVVLIYFIHHVPQSINVTNVIARVGDDLIASIQSLYPEQIGHGPPPNPTPDLPDDFAQRGKVVCVPGEGGYLRLVDNETLMNAACEHELIVEILQQPGEFALPGEPLLRVWPGETLDDELRNKLTASFSWGSERTPNQDVLLPVQQLLEIIGRALSPGVNNQYTAVLGINQLGRGLREMLSREVPDSRRTDGDEKLRVVAEPVDHEAFLQAMAGPLHQYIDGDWIAATHTVDMFERLAALPELETSRELLESAASSFGQPGEPGAKRPG